MTNIRLRMPALCGLLAVTIFNAQLGRAQSSNEQTESKPAAAASCIAVKPVGSHAFRNIMLAGVAGALISKQQYEVVAVSQYPARVGEKYHGNDLQTIQASGTRIVILDKHPSEAELSSSCR